MKWLVLLVMLAGVSALNVSYDGRIIAQPGSRVTSQVYVLPERSEVLSISCWGMKGVSCPRELKVTEGRETSFNVSFTSLVGESTLSIRLGEEMLKIKVIGSNQTSALNASLEKFRSVFSNLESKYGRSRTTELARSLIIEGEEAYEREDYVAVEGILENLDALLEDYYSNIPVREAPPARLGLNWVPLVLLAILGVFLALRKREPEKVEVTGVAELVKQEMGGS